MPLTWAFRGLMRPSSIVAAIVVFLHLLLATCASAQTEKRFALLIGNQSYSSAIGALTNPHNDVALLEKTLKSLGFEVVVERDAGLGAMTRAVNSYARRLAAAGPGAVGFFYYSGHGAADGSVNYLIPVDVKTTETGELWDQSLRLTEITRKLKAEASNATHFVVFDACRNALKLTKPGTRAIIQSKGFVPVAQESGMLIAYATAEGELASDVGVGAGPYARILAEEIVKPGVEAVYMFRRVQVRVRSTIGQEPWLGFSALGEVNLAGTEAGKSSAPTTDRTAEADRAWRWVKDTGSPGALENYIREYGDTPFGAMARARLEDLKKQRVAAAAPPPPSYAEHPAYDLHRTGTGEEACRCRPAVVRKVLREQTGGRCGAATYCAGSLQRPCCDGRGRAKMPQTKGHIQGLRRLPGDGGGAGRLIHDGIAGE